MHTMSQSDSYNVFNLIQQQKKTLGTILFLFFSFSFFND